MIIVGLLLLTFKYDDGSVLLCRATSFIELLETYGISGDGISMYDVDAKKQIPYKLFDLDYNTMEIEEDYLIKYESALDKFLSEHVKGGW